LLPMTFIVQRPAAGLATLGMTLWIFVFAALSESLERYLFFTASVPMRMPGGIET
jgi:hypothetical protein